MRRVGKNFPFLVLCLALSLMVRLTVGIGVVSGLSMWPSLDPGDTVVYLRCLGPSPGSVVVADLPGHGPIIKRVAAAGSRTADSGRPVPDGYCYLLGDNRDHSYDSREFGPFPDRLVIGRVVVVWPHHPPSSPVSAFGPASAR